MSSMDIIIGPPNDFLMTRRKTMYHHVVACHIVKPGEETQRHRFSHPSQWEVIKGVKELMWVNGWTSCDAIEWTFSNVLEGTWIGSDSEIEFNYILPECLHRTGLNLLQKAFYRVFL